MCKKRLFFNVLNYWTLPFPGLFVWMEKDRDPVKCNACAVNQKIVTAWFSGYALFSTEPLVRIS